MNTLYSNIFDNIDTQPIFSDEMGRFEVLSQELLFKLKFTGFSDVHLGNGITKINQVLFADDKSSIVIIRPLVNNKYHHTVINALTRDGFDDDLFNEILNTFVYGNLRYALAS